MNIVIIGNGVSGISTARFIRKMSDHKITVISSESEHFFSRTALMYIYMGHMTYNDTKPYEDWFWEKNRINLVKDYVSSVDFNNQTLQLKSGQSMAYDKLVLAVGSKPNKFGWPGQDLNGVQGLYSMQDLELLESNTKSINNAVIVGGGLIGIELAEMLLSRKISVSFLVREQSFWDNVLPAEESALINRHIEDHHIDLQLATELKEIIPDSEGRVKEVLTSKGEVIPCQLVGLTAGVRPKIDFIENSELATQRGILVNHYLETNMPNVYAVGDCAQFTEPIEGRAPIEQVWYTGKRQGATVAHTICGNRQKYNPRLWFNSAKFLDIEYQTYGRVWNTLREDEDQFYWEHSNGKVCLKVVFDKKDNVVKGVNVFGMRLRHDVLEDWLLQNKTLDYYIANMSAANFDPEFYEKYEKQILKKYNNSFPSVKLKLSPISKFRELIFNKGISKG